MKKNITLVIMAAGMGSRFGGLKQIEPVGPNGEFIIDYSIYDAIRAGFNKVVFIIKEENYEIFRDTIGKRIEKQIKVDYVFQDPRNIPKGVKAPKDRVKPWGTSHAILSCKDKVDTDFLVINADDFYGRDAYEVASKYLNGKHKDNEFALVGYKTANTLTENGSVKRGVCEEKDHYLTSIIESSVERKDGDIVASPLDGSKPFKVKDDSLVSMNMFCFTPKLFPYLDKNFKAFFDANKDDLTKCEYLIPESVFNAIKEGYATMEVLPTNAVWQGITYKEDKEQLVNSIKELIEKGEYPQKLWK